MPKIKKQQSDATADATNALHDKKPMYVWILTQVTDVDDYKRRGEEPSVDIVGVFRSRDAMAKAMMARRIEYINECLEELELDNVPIQFHPFIYNKRASSEQPVASDEHEYGLRVKSDAQDEHVVEMFQYYSNGEYVQSKTWFTSEKHKVM
jgi:hypothetical protein